MSAGERIKYKKLQYNIYREEAKYKHYIRQN